MCLLVNADELLAADGRAQGDGSDRGHAHPQRSDEGLRVPFGQQGHHDDPHGLWGVIAWLMATVSVAGHCPTWNQRLIREGKLAKRVKNRWVSSKKPPMSLKKDGEEEQGQQLNPLRIVPEMR